MDEVCELLRGVTPDGTKDDKRPFLSPWTTSNREYETSDMHTAMILNNVGVRSGQFLGNITANVDDDRHDQAPRSSSFICRQLIPNVSSELKANTTEAPQY